MPQVEELTGDFPLLPQFLQDIAQRWPVFSPDPDRPVGLLPGRGVEYVLMEGVRVAGVTVRIVVAENNAGPQPGNSCLKLEPTILIQGRPARVMTSNVSSTSI